MNSLFLNIVGVGVSKYRHMHRRQTVTSDDVIEQVGTVSDGQLQKMIDLLSKKNMTFEELVSQRLLGSTMRPTSTTFQQIPDNGSAAAGVSWGLILPIVFVGIFLVCVAGCLYWHNWRDKRRLQGEATVPNLSLSTFSRTTGNGDEWKQDLRGSTRSTTPLRTGSRENKATIHPMAYHNSLTDSLSTSRSSYSTNAGTSFCRDDHERHFHPRRKLSPIDETAMYVPKLMGANVASVSQYEGCVASQSVCSPYHLTWVSPQTAGVAMRMEDVNNNRTASDASYYRSAKSSPFFPNNNTPTADVDSFGQTPSRLVNPITPSVPMSYTNMAVTRYPSSDASSETSFTDGSGVTTIGAVSSLGFHRADRGPGSQRSLSDVGTASRSSSDMSSLPSSINPYRQRSRPSRHQSAHNDAITVISQTTAFNEPLASSIDSCTSSDNTSLYPNVGSSMNTTAHPLSLPSNPVGQAASYPTSPQTRAQTDERFNTAVAMVDGEPRTCLLHADGASFVSNASNVAATLFRSWSASAELDYTPSVPAQLVPSPMSEPTVTQIARHNRQFSGQTSDDLSRRFVVGSDSHNNLDKSHSDQRHVVFQNIPPVLDDKKYWL